MKNLFADRIKGVPKSFIREILKVSQGKDIISFAGGLPNPKFFPAKEILEAATKVLKEDGSDALQYSTTEGYYPLRKYISERYKLKRGLIIPPDEILITNGAQQAIALSCKTFLNPGDNVIIEKPGYLGAIQAMSFYEPTFHGVELLEDGIDTEMLQRVYEEFNVKLFYSIPNYQNPSGITYSNLTRYKVSEILSNFNSVFIEDDPYYEMGFTKRQIPSIKTYYSKNVILTGSFSKIVAPAFRIGWLAADAHLMDKISLAKQSSDLHTNYFTQRVLYRYLQDNDIDAHIVNISSEYRKQKDIMVECITKYFPEEVKFTNPEGGMFLWLTLPEYVSSYELNNTAMERKVCFVPGREFYTCEEGVNKFRLNYTNSSEEKIVKGIKVIGDLIKEKIINKYYPSFSFTPYIG